MTTCAILLLILGSFSGAFAAERISDIRPAAAATGSNSITGFVFGASGRPVPNVYVELLSDTGSTLAREKTAGSGMYAFRGLSDGVFVVRVLPYTSGYQGSEQRVSLVTVSAFPGRGSINEQVNFYLKPNMANKGPLAAPEVLFAQEVPDKAKDLYEKGIEELADNKEKEGFENLKAALEIFPDYYLALDRLGTEYVVRRYYRAAYVLLEKSLAVNPRSFSSRLGMGIVEFRLGLTEPSIKSLTLAVEAYGQSVAAHIWLGIALHKASRLAEAETELVKANRLSEGKSADAHWHLGRLYKDQGRYADAANELELVIKINPDHPSAEGIKKAIVMLREKAPKNANKMRGQTIRNEYVYPRTSSGPLFRSNVAGIRLRP
ncbi:MAG: tetratricopeptide repeat protein [Pyrinomonadaceae bacterium]